VEGEAEFASAAAYWRDMEKGAAPVAMMKRAMPSDV